MSLTSTPASISSAAIRCVRGVGVLVHELAGVGDQADVERRGDLRGDLGPEQARRARRRSRPCRRRSTSTRLTSPKRVLSWWWSMLMMTLPPSLRKSTGMRSMLPQSRKTTVRSAMSAGGSWKTSSSGRKRYSIGSGNSFAARNITESLPSWVEQLVHAEQRAERVAVGALVGGEQEAVARRAARRRPARARVAAAVGALTHLARRVSGLVLEQLRDPHRPARPSSS